MNETATPHAPLAGIRILSLAEQYPGPLATLLLADLGADIILVERPAGGDPSRRYAGHFSALNRNKRSITIDLKSDAGRDTFLRLVDTADVVVEGYRPGVMARLALDQDTLSRRKPGLIYASISSFGQTGPMAELAGHDLSIQAAAGLIDIPPGAEGTTPLPVLPLADIASGMFAAFAILSMILARFRGRPIMPIDISMLDCLAGWVAPIILPLVNETAGAPFPPNEPGYGVFHTSDQRQLTLSIAGEDRMWRELCDMLDLNEFQLLAEPERIAKSDVIQPILRQQIAAHDWVWIEDQFTKRAIAFGPVMRLRDVPNDPQIASRGLFAEIEHNSGFERHAHLPITFTGAARPTMRAAPLLGEHTEEIVGELQTVRQ